MEGWRARSELPTAMGRQPAPQEARLIPPAGPELNASMPFAGDKDGGPLHRRRGAKSWMDPGKSHFGPGGLVVYLTDWGRWAINGLVQLSVWLSSTSWYLVQTAAWVLSELLWEWLEREFLAWCADWCTEAYRAVRIFLGCVFAGILILALVILYFICTCIVIPLIVAIWKMGRGVLHATSYLLGKRPWQAPDGLEWYGVDGANDLTEDWLRGPFKQRSDTGQKPPDVTGREAEGGVARLRRASVAGTVNAQGASLRFTWIVAAAPSRLSWMPVPAPPMSAPSPHALR